MHLSREGVWHCLPQAWFAAGNESHFQEQELLSRGGGFFHSSEVDQLGILQIYAFQALGRPLNCLNPIF